MARVLVCGNANLETTLRVESFPLEYAPVHYRPYGVRSRAGGVGLNVACALAALGGEVRLASLIGEDAAGASIRAEAAWRSVDGEFLLAAMPESAQSVVIYDGAGRRQVHSDLKDLPSRPYPPEAFREALRGCRAAVMTNVYYSRALLPLAREAGALVACDVQDLDSLDNEYNLPFLHAADLLFLSHEKLPQEPAAFAASLLQRYPARAVVVGLGAAGALFATRDGGSRVVPAPAPRPVVNTVGAGDALLAAFLHFTLAGMDPLPALERAVLYASWKVGEDGGTAGHLGEKALEELRASLGG
ncbi:MAG TPA: carbohydrate kinase family protein [Deinococcales bacterium]|nr:carbohydrate kinase family protein [Deinococcales bacterium]